MNWSSSPLWGLGPCSEEGNMQPGGSASRGRWSGWAGGWGGGGGTWTGWAPHATPGEFGRAGSEKKAVKVCQPSSLLKDLDDQISKVWESEENEDKRESRQKSIASTNSSSSFSLLLQNLSAQYHSLICNESWQSVIQEIVLNELIYSNLYFFDVSKIS